MRSAGFNPAEACVVIAVRKGAGLRDVWNVRIQYSPAFRHLDIVEKDHYLLVIGQGFRKDDVSGSLLQQLRTNAPAARCHIPTRDQRRKSSNSDYVASPSAG